MRISQTLTISLLSPLFIALASAQVDEGGMTFEVFAKREKVKHLTPEKQRVLFDRIDKNRDGRLDLKETARSARYEGGIVAPVPWPKQVQKVDEDKDGRLTIQEFLMLPNYSNFTIWNAREAFAMMDVDDNGFLDEFEMQDARQKSQRTPNLSRMDLDGDGKVDKAEFVQAPMIKKLPKGRQDFVFDRLDKNKDGAIDGQDEAKP